MSKVLTLTCRELVTWPLRTPWNGSSRVRAPGCLHHFLASNRPISLGEVVFLHRSCVSALLPSGIEGGQITMYICLAFSQDPSWQIRNPKDDDLGQPNKANKNDMIWSHDLGHTIQGFQNIYCRGIHCPFLEPWCPMQPKTAKWFRSGFLRIHLGDWNMCLNDKKQKKQISLYQKKKKRNRKVNHMFNMWFTTKTVVYSQIFCFKSCFKTAPFLFQVFSDGSMRFTREVERS